MLNAITDMIKNAKASVDFAGLNPPPSGQFLDAIKKGLRDRPPGAPHILLRFLIGTPPPETPDPGTLFLRLHDALRSGDDVQIAMMNTNATAFGLQTSWDHSKVLDVDGTTAIVGGTNWWPNNYAQSADPVNDVSMVVSGPAAANATSFENLMWTWVCQNRGNRSLMAYFTNTADRSCVSDARTLPAPTTGNVPILTVAGLGNGISVPGQVGRKSPPIAPLQGESGKCHLFQTQNQINDDPEYQYRNPDETAMRALIASAKKSVFLSQQDLLSCAYKVESLFDVRVFQALADKIKEKVPVTIVLSDRYAKSAGISYSNGYSLQDVAVHLRKVIQAQYKIPEAQARAMLCQDVYLAEIRNANAAKWPNGSHFANHAKVIAVDGSAFYVGSENLYPARLQELGMIIESPSAAATLQTQYLSPLRQYSEAGALINPQAGKCEPF